MNILNFYKIFEYPIELKSVDEGEEESAEEKLLYFLHPEDALFEEERPLKGLGMLKYSKD